MLSHVLQGGKIFCQSCWQILDFFAVKVARFTSQKHYTYLPVAQPLHTYYTNCIFPNRTIYQVKNQSCLNFIHVTFVTTCSKSMHQLYILYWTCSVWTIYISKLSRIWEPPPLLTERSTCNLGLYHNTCFDVPQTHINMKHTNVGGFPILKVTRKCVRYAFKYH